MADPVEPVSRNDEGTPRYNVASPGLSGALSDAIGAVAKAVAPKSITQRAAKLKQAEDDANDPTGRMRAAQSTDKDNNASY